MIGIIARPVHVLGSGCIAAPGRGADRLESALDDGWRPPEVNAEWRADDSTSARVAAVRGLEDHLRMRGLRSLSRTGRLCCIAAADALGHPDVPPGPPERTAVVVGTRWGSIEPLVEFNRAAVTAGPRLVNPSHFPNVVVNAHAGYLGTLFGPAGPNLTVCGPAAGLEAIGQAADLLDLGRAEHALAGGVEALGTTVLRGLASEGSGDVPGEGAGFLFLGPPPGRPGARVAAWASESVHDPEDLGPARSRVVEEILEAAGLGRGDGTPLWHVGEPPNGAAAGLEGGWLDPVVGSCHAAGGALAAVVAARSATAGRPSVAASFPRDGTQVAVAFVPA